MLNLSWNHLNNYMVMEISNKKGKEKDGK